MMNPSPYKQVLMSEQNYSFDFKFDVLGRDLQKTCNSLFRAIVALQLISAMRNYMPPQLMVSWVFLGTARTDDLAFRTPSVALVLD